MAGPPVMNKELLAKLEYKKKVHKRCRQGQVPQDKQNFFKVCRDGLRKVNLIWQGT